MTITITLGFCFQRYGPAVISQDEVIDPLGEAQQYYLIRNTRNSMSYVNLVIIAIVVFMCPASLSAGKVYTWTDANDNVHITDEPPPENAEVQNVINYKPQPENEVMKDQRRQEMQEETAERKQKNQEAKKAEQEAQKAAEDARMAREKADAVVKDANEYIDTHNRNQYMRRAYKYEMKKKAREAEAAVKQANAAAEEARTAEEKSKTTSEELNDFYE